jgi:proline reductase-associated electron transfer protein PrdC
MKVVLPLRQHIGAPCKPCVEKDQEVKKGQLIAVPDGLGANIHSSVYGVVTNITDEAIEIACHEEQLEEFVKIKDTDSNLEAIKEAGVVGAGGAGFPAHVKFNADLKGGYVLANAAECEPLLAHNVELMENNPELVVKGVKYVMEITNAKKGYIAVKPKHKKAIMALGKACKNVSGVEVKFLPDMYPAGDERVVIRELVGVELKPGQLPLEAGCVVSNVETLKNVVLAIEERKPVITKDITIAGRVKDAMKGKVYMDVPLGLSVGKYIEMSGGYIKPHGEIVLGGPFTGKAGSEESPITKTTGGAIVSMPFPNDEREFGIIICECGAGKERLTEIVEGMGGKVVAETMCKRMVDDGRGRYRCELPGMCPGQAEKVLYLKKEGAKAVVVGTCED